MNTNLGYSKLMLTDSNVLLSGGGHKALSDFVGTLYWDSTNKKIQYKKIGDTNYTDLLTFGSNAFNSTSYLPLSGGTMVGTISAANDAYGGGGFNNGYVNLILRGNTTTGTSGIVFSSSKGDTSINRPSDCAFIQFLPYGVSAATAVGTNPTINTSGEAGRFVIGIHNDSGDQLWLQTSAVNDLKHVVGANVYTIYDSGNLPAYPTKASWNYNDMYVASVSISENNLRINKNGTNTDLTIPYATSAGSTGTLSATSWINGSTSELPHLIWHIPNTNWGNLSMNASGEFFFRNTNDTSAGYANLYANLPDYAKLGAHNNLTASTNEFTFASSGFSGAMYINYRTAGGTNGNITSYLFCKGNMETLATLDSTGTILTSSNWSNYISNSGGNTNNTTLLTNNTTQAGNACYDANPGLHFYRYSGDDNTIGGVDGWIMQWSWSPGSVGGLIYLDDNPSGIIGIRGCTGSSGTAPTGFTSWWRLYSDNYHPSADYATSAGAVAWDNVSGKPTVVTNPYTGHVQITGRVFGYNYGNQGNNAVAFMWDKPGNYYTGMGPNGVADLIHFGPCNGDGTWVSEYSLKWDFQGNVYASNFYTTSDIRKKTNITNISDSIRQFNWKDSGELSYGFIAQELEKTNPELVNKGEDHWTVNYNAAICLVIARLENRIKELEKQLGV